MKFSHGSARACVRKTNQSIPAERLVEWMSVRDRTTEPGAISRHYVD